MSLQQELNSWFAPEPSQTSVASTAPEIGSRAPQTDQLSVPLDHDVDSNSNDNSDSDKDNARPSIILFSRHCGCPFAEKAFLNLRETAQRHRDYDFIFVSQSDHDVTHAWLASLPQAGSEPRNLHWRFDPGLEIYGAWGLGVSSFAHVLTPASLYSALRLGLDEGIWNRPTVSGSRWQTGGAFGVDAEGVVRWGGAATRADDVARFEPAIVASAKAMVGGQS